MEKYFSFNRDLSLTELEGKSWIEPGTGSHLVTTCFELMKKPVRAFDEEDLRIMIGQKIGLDYLVPLALELLEDNIFAEGKLYSGDLLDVVLQLDKDFWANNNTYMMHIEEIFEKNIEDLTNKLKSFRQKLK